MEPLPLLVIEALSKRFPKALEDAVQNVSLELQRGSFLGLVGPDGAGKTTLLRLIAGLMKASTGRIRIDGLDPIESGAQVREIVGYMPQRFGLYEDLTVQENLDLNADLRGVLGSVRQASYERLLAFTDLAPFTRRKAGALSGGMKQKLGLACALLARPRLLLLDEPSVGVDPLSRRELWRMVHELVGEGMSVVWSTAYLDEAERCGRVLLLNHGQTLFSGDPKDLTAQVADRTYRIKNLKTGCRKLLAHLLDLETVSDGVIEGSSIRILLKQGIKPSAIAEEFSEGQTLLPVSPRFEDAFIDLLGGGPGGTSVLAEKMVRKELPSHEPVVEARGLSKQFGDFYATRDVSFAIQPGEIFGLLGPNGAGKSTTFKMMCGLLRPTVGQALVTGLNLVHAGGRARQRIGYMAQKFSLYGTLSVRQNLDFFAGAYGLIGRAKRERIELMVEIFGLGPMLDETPDGLPLGFKQRLALACSVMHEPDILFLDEPTSGVDPVTRREFWMHIYGLTARGVTIMVTTHFMDEAEYCDRIGLVSRGELIALGSPDSLKKKSQSRDELVPPDMEEAFIRLIDQAQPKKTSAA